MRAAVDHTWRLVRADAARWIRPQGFADPDEVTLRRLVPMLVRHLPLRATTWFRLGGLAEALGWRGVPGIVQRRLLVRYGLEISPGSHVGGGLYIAHPVGCVLVAERIGEGLTVIGAATFGTRDDARRPVVGDRVFVGIGARVLGGITIGDGASIGANAVVLHDVEPGRTVVGIPARPVAGARAASAS